MVREVKDISKKQIAFGLEIKGGEKVSLTINGVEITSFVSPMDGTLSCYLNKTKEQ